MKSLLILLFLATSLLADELPAGTQILEFCRANLPTDPIEMTGSLKEHAANGFVTRKLTIDMSLYWGGVPQSAHYRIADKKKKVTHALDVEWAHGESLFEWRENDVLKEEINVDSEIDGLGITASDLSFSFLWSTNATTLRMAKKLGRECYVLSVPRPEEHELILWIEKKNGMFLEAEELDAAGKRVKIIDVVGVKKFGTLWMVKDLNIVRFPSGKTTSLKVDTVKVGS